MSRPSPTPLIFIILVYLALAGAYALRTPAWQAPDEPAHYNYIAQTAESGCCPVIASGDWDAEYLDRLKESRFAPTLLDELPAVQYEDHQPPLYYLLLSPIYALTGGSLFALRLVTIMIGLTIVIYAYILTWLILPKYPGAALGAAALVAVLPQFLAITASVNNDALSWSLIGLALIGVVTYLYGESRDLRTEIMIGIIVGLALLTKLNALFLLGVVPLAIVLKWREKWRSIPLRAGAFLLPALALAGLWWARNLAVYGVPDIFGLAAHDRVVVGQLRTASLIAEVGTAEYTWRALTTTFQSFFGQFGWMALPLPAWIYAGIALLLLGALAGWLWRRPHSDSDDPALHPGRQRIARGMMAVVLLLALAQYAYYNTEFVQFQGRYLYTGLLPFAALTAAGLDRLMIGAGGAHRYSHLWFVGLLSPLILLNIWVLWRVLPALAP